MAGLSLNKVFLIGNLTRDPELRYIPSGQAVATFTVATNRTYLASSGEKKEETAFIRVVTWGRSAEVCNDFLKKGSPVFVEGRLQSRSWQAQDGSKRSTIEVVAQRVQFLGKASAARAEAPPAGEVPEAVGEDSSGGRDSTVRVSQEELQPDDEVPF